MLLPLRRKLIIKLHRIRSILRNLLLPSRLIKLILLHQHQRMILKFLCFSPDKSHNLVLFAREIKSERVHQSGVRDFEVISNVQVQVHAGSAVREDIKGELVELRV